MRKINVTIWNEYCHEKLDENIAKFTWKEFTVLLTKSFRRRENLVSEQQLGIWKITDCLMRFWIIRMFSFGGGI